MSLFLTSVSRLMHVCFTPHISFISHICITRPTCVSYFSHLFHTPHIYSHQFCFSPLTSVLHLSYDTSISLTYPASPHRPRHSSLFLCLLLLIPHRFQTPPFHGLSGVLSSHPSPHKLFVHPTRSHPSRLSHANITFTLSSSLPSLPHLIILPSLHPSPTLPFPSHNDLCRPVFNFLSRFVNNQE